MWEISWDTGLLPELEDSLEKEIAVFLYSCLENSTGRRAWQITVLEVTHARPQRINNVVVVSGEQQRDSAMHGHVSILPQTPLPSRLTSHVERSSMCYTIDPRWLSILSIAVCIWPSQTPCNVFKIGFLWDFYLLCFFFLSSFLPSFISSFLSFFFFFTVPQGMQYLSSSRRDRTCIP